MVGYRRGQIKIVADMLEVGKEGTKKTHFMYRCNLSYKQLNKYLRMVLGANLLEKVNNSDGFDVYRTTEKGYEFLRGMKHIDRMLNFP